MKPNTPRSPWLAATLLLLLGSAAVSQDAPPGAAPPGNAPARRGDDAPPARNRPPEGAQQPQAPIGPPLPTVSLASLVERVARTSNKVFLIDSHVNQQVYLGGTRPEDVTYPVLLSILRTNNMAAVTIEGRVNIVPEPFIRSYPVPMVQNDDPNIAADEWVSRIITVNKIQASGLVPILRPLLPPSAHLAAMCKVCETGSPTCTSCEQLLVMDRYANVKRITGIVKALDQ